MHNFTSYFYSLFFTSMSKECLDGDTISDIDIGSDDYCKNYDEGYKETIHDENAKSY